MIAVLAQVDALPGPKRQLSLLYRQLQLKAQQTALEVRRQIIRPFVIMFVARRLKKRSKSRRTAGSAFSFTVNDAEVCCSHRCNRPIRICASSGNLASTSSVTR